MVREILNVGFVLNTIHERLTLYLVSSWEAFRCYEQLPFHVRLAMENGLSEEELIEAMTHLAFYAGWPRAASAIRVAQGIFEELRSDKR